MYDHIRSLSRIQKIGVGVGTLILFCCGCLFSISLLPTPAEEETTAANSAAVAVGEAETVTAVARESESVAAQLETAGDTEAEPSATASPQPPTETPVPSPTPQPTETAVPLTGSVRLDSGEEVSGELALVTRIVDGDTIEVAIDGQTVRVRYIGMDTPESGTPFFDEATEANRRLVEGATVILVKDVSETDRFGRLLRYVYLEDGTFVNGELVRQGFAQVATFPPDVAHEADFVAWEQAARDDGRGLWAGVVAAAPTNTPVPQPTNTPLPPPTNTAVPAPTNTLAPAPTATPVPLPTDTPPPPPTNTPEPVAAPGAVVISYIFYDGVEPTSEGDEYAVITNQGGTAVNMGGWRLNADDSGQDFWFPAFDLQPGQSCRVYTNQIHGDSCGGQGFGRGSALWANSGECGHLFDAGGAEVSTYCY